MTEIAGHSYFPGCCSGGESIHPAPVTDDEFFDDDLPDYDEPPTYMVDNLPDTPDDPWAGQPPLTRRQKLRRLLRGTRHIAARRLTDRTTLVVRFDARTWVVGYVRTWDEHAVHVGPLCIALTEPPF